MLQQALANPGETPFVGGACLDETYLWASFIAGHIIRQNARLVDEETIELAEQKLSPTEFMSPGGRILKRIVNSSLDVRNQRGYAQRTSDYLEDTCSNAEYSFIETIAELRRPPRAKCHSARLIGSPDKPLLLQKFEGVKSALSLCALTIDGVTFPPGSIMGVDLKRDFDAGKDKYVPRLPQNTRAIVPASEIEHMTFLRPSLFAFSRPARLAYASPFIQETKVESARQRGRMVDTMLCMTVNGIARVMQNFSATDDR
jgi:hypothetical protein